MITSEDSTKTCIKQNTFETDQPVRPPPRRKDRFQNSKDITNMISPLKIEKQNDNIFEKGEKLNKNYKNKSVKDVEYKANIRKTAAKPADENVTESKHLFGTEKYQELLKTNTNGFSKYKEVEQLKEDCLEVNANSKTSEDYRNVLYNLKNQQSNIIENITEDRVLDIPLEVDYLSRSISIEKNSLSLGITEALEYNRACDKLLEKPATIVGVFYKPEYCSLNVEDKENHEFTDNGRSNKFGICSKENDINKKVTSELIIGSKKGNKICIKDSEEIDSGVYFSDSKSPPHKQNYFEIAEQESRSSYLNYDCQFYKSVSCNNSDTIDNKSSGDLGPPSYETMLDYFEAQTVKTFHKEISSQFSLYSGEFQKENTVRDWLNSEDCLSKQRKRFSEYLRNMLELSDSPGSLSPYPLSVVDEDNVDSVSDIARETEILEKNIDRNPILEACLNQSSLTNDNEYSKLADSNNVDSVVNMNIVYNTPVNNHSDIVTQNKITNINYSLKDNDDSDNENQETGSIDVFNTKASNNVLINVCETSGFIKESNYLEIACLTSDIEKSNNVNPRFALSPSIKHGAVISLIAYFENIQKQENADFNYDSDEDFESSYEFQGNFETNSITVSLDSLQANEEHTVKNEREFESTDNFNDVVFDCCPDNQKSSGDTFIINSNCEMSEPNCSKYQGNHLPWDGFTTKDKTVFGKNKHCQTPGSNFKEITQNCCFETLESSLTILENVDSSHKDQLTNENECIETSKNIACDNHITVNQPKTERSNSNNKNNSEIQNTTDVDLEEINILFENDETTSEDHQNYFDKPDKTIESIESAEMKYADKEFKTGGETRTIQAASQVSKPTRIPIVILTDDIGSSHVGSLELHPSDFVAMEIENLGKKVYYISK